MGSHCCSSIPIASASLGGFLPFDEGTREHSFNAATWTQCPNGVPVNLNIYDLNEDLVQPNKLLMNYLHGGVFHAGVEIAGTEWSYGVQGVFKGPPRNHTYHVFRSTIEMGNTPLPQEQLHNVLAEIQVKWSGQDYDLINRNCCAFCDALCEELHVGPIPEWVNSLAESVGQMYLTAGSAYQSVTGSVGESLAGSTPVSSSMGCSSPARSTGRGADFDPDIVPKGVISPTGFAASPALGRSWSFKQEQLSTTCPMNVLVQRSCLPRSVSCIETRSHSPLRGEVGHPGAHPARCKERPGALCQRGAAAPPGVLPVLVPRSSSWLVQRTSPSPVLMGASSFRFGEASAPIQKPRPAPRSGVEQ